MCKEGKESEEEDQTSECIGEVVKDAETSEGRRKKSMGEKASTEAI